MQVFNRHVSARGLTVFGFEPLLISASLLVSPRAFRTSRTFESGKADFALAAGRAVAAGALRAGCCAAGLWPTAGGTAFTGCTGRATGAAARAVHGSRLDGPGRGANISARAHRRQRLLDRRDSGPRLRRRTVALCFSSDRFRAKQLRTRPGRTCRSVSRISRRSGMSSRSCVVRRSR